MKLVMLIRSDGRRVNIPGREAAMFEALADYIEEITASRNGAFTLSYRDEKVTPDHKKIGKTYRGDEMREAS